MKFIIGEGGWSWLERIAYRGCIGIFYDSTWGGVLTYLIVGLICLFAVIGVISVLKWLIFGKPKKNKDPYKEWIKSGKM